MPKITELIPGPVIDTISEDERIIKLNEQRSEAQFLLWDIELSIEARLAKLIEKNTGNECSVEIPFNYDDPPVDALVRSANVHPPHKR